MIDERDDLIHSAKPVPLRDQVRADQAKLYDILDRTRSMIPEELRQTRWIVKERDEMPTAPKHEAERSIKEARERQTQFVAQHERTRYAERAAQDIIADARTGERDIRLGAKRTTPTSPSARSRSTSRSSSPPAQRGRERLHGPDDAAEVGNAAGSPRTPPAIAGRSGRYGSGPRGPRPYTVELPLRRPCGDSPRDAGRRPLGPRLPRHRARLSLRQRRLVDDHAVDPRLRNDLGLLSLVDPGAHGPRRLEPLPLRLERCHTCPARGDDAD